MKDKFKNIFILAIWILIWGVIALIIGNSIILAGPVDVLLKISDNILKSDFWLTVLNSILRILIAYVIACILGCIIAILSNKFKAFYSFITPFLQVVKSAPIVCFIAVLMLIITKSSIDIVVIVISVIPIFYFSIYEACQHRNKNIVDALKVFCVPWKTKFFCYEWPNALPYFNQATKTATGVAWKSGVTAQMMGELIFSIGLGVQQSKESSDSAQLLIWMFIVVILGWAFEKIIIFLVGYISKKTIKISTKNNIKSNKCSITDEADIILANICKHFGNKQIFDNYTLRIKSGERVAIFGSTGSGKSTLIKIILGIEKPDNGEVFVKEFTPRTFSAVLQENSLINYLSVSENIKLFCNSNGTNTLVEENEKVENLSGGMKRCAEIERAIECDSKIVVMDEAFTGLDDNIKNKAINYINENLNGRTLIIITHNLDEARALNCKIEKI